MRLGLWHRGTPRRCRRCRAAVSAAAEGEHQAESAVQNAADKLGVGEQTAATLDHSHQEIAAAVHSKSGQAMAHWVAENGVYVTGGIGLASALLGHPLGMLKAGAIGAAAGAAVGTGVGFVQSHNASRT